MAVTRKCSPCLYPDYTIYPAIHINHIVYRSYPAKMRCQVTYKLGSGCKKLQFYCPRSAVDLINKDQKKCRKGDVMIIGKKRWLT